MIPNRPSGFQLQRRTGRRTSTPTSPTSPSFQRKFGRSQEVPWPSEPRSAITAAESPSIDIQLPSSAIDLPLNSPTFHDDVYEQTQSQPTNRASDDLGKNRPKFLAETGRPATSGSGIAKTHITQTSTYSPDPTEARASPRIGHGRTSGETPRRSSSRETQDDHFTSSLRAANIFSQNDRSVFDDTAAIKSVTQKKSRFNLLSPMSLFQRRRTSQSANKLGDTNLSVNSLHVPAMPDHVNPSIRGNFVHDFSAPKVRRVKTDVLPHTGPEPSPGYPRRPSDFGSPAMTQVSGNPPSTHSPMFTEHFQDNQRSVQPTNTAYLHGQNLQVPTKDTLPSFAKKLPLNVPDGRSVDTSSANDVQVNEDKNQQRNQLPPVPELPPPPPPERTPSPVQEFNPNGTLPRHMASTSSRFSFQIGQQGSLAQEKYLEDRHKEHAAKQPADVRLSVTSMNDYDDYDDDIDEDDGGFDLGGVTIRNIDMPTSHVDEFSGPVEEDYGYDNEDGDDDDFGTGDIEVRNVDVPTSRTTMREDANKKTHRQSLQAFHFTPQSLSFSPGTAQHTSESTPRDFDGLPIGMAEFKQIGAYGIHPQIRNSVDTSPETTFFEGLGISTASQLEPVHSIAGAGAQPFDDSDLYFDDGEFVDHVTDSVDEFNEDHLDDATKIKDIPAENARKYDEAVQRSLPGEKIQAVTVAATNKSDSHASPPSIPEIKTPTKGHGSDMDDQSGLTEGNLAAHHDALAMVVNQAAADGKFDRNVSFSQVSDDGTDSSFHNSMHGISSRGSHYSNNIMSSVLSDDDAFGFDEDMDDDDMIAAANAEALENDDEGVYGQEFGFYARAHSKDAAQFLNGGYFTSRGSNGLKRSHSGKATFQEPSLTPITERSEWSARNSVYSLPIPPGIPSSAQSLPSPGIADLINMDSPLVDGEMSYKTLMRLRRDTFGGSSTSINSLGDRHHSHSSPLAHAGEYLSSPGDLMGRRMSSPTPGFSSLAIAESEDEDDKNDRPTVTQNTPQKIRAQTISQALLEQPVSSPLARKANHSRNSSGAESISYAQDRDGRWVMEKRRMGDDGEAEVFEREYLVGARI